MKIEMYPGFAILATFVPSRNSRQLYFWWLLQALYYYWYIYIFYLLLRIRRKQLSFM